MTLLASAGSPLLAQLAANAQRIRAAMPTRGATGPDAFAATRAQAGNELAQFHTPFHGRRAPLTKQPQPGPMPGGALRGVQPPPTKQPGQMPPLLAAAIGQHEGVAAPKELDPYAKAVNLVRLIDTLLAGGHRKR